MSLTRRAHSSSYTLSNERGLTIQYAFFRALALPETYVGLDKYGVRQSVSRLVGPLAAALKGDGPAAFIAASVIFVAQQAEVDLNIGQIFTVV